jgi:protein involved in polysaccharide export with SLBB domain
MIRRGVKLVGVSAFCAVAGCEVDSYFDPAKTGRFEFTPTTIPILERIDVIEREPDPWARATRVGPEDLVPTDLTYRISSGDQIRVEIFELAVTGQIWASSQRLDATGVFRLPAPLGDVPAAGLTAQEFQDRLIRLVDERVMPNPVVNVYVEDGAGFTYTLYGGVQGAGLYALRKSDFRLLDALAQAGAIYQGVQKIYIVRHIPFTEEGAPPPPRGTATQPPSREIAPDIEELIRQLESPPGPGPAGKPPVSPPAPKAPESPAPEQEQAPIDIEELLKEIERTPGTAPGAFAQEDEPAYDDVRMQPLPPPPAAPQPASTAAPKVSAPGAAASWRRDRYAYDAERDEWVVVPTGAPKEAAASTPEPLPPPRPFLERIIEVPYEKLKQGDSSYNIIIRPNDRIYVREPQSGVVYLDGEIGRPGVYSFPATGKMTLSRLVAAAGGPGPLAIPSRVDLTRIVGENREATIRLNLSAIRQRTEPDLYLRPDDHIIIGTSFIAYPLAVFRNGLRMTYGFGFLLDRNFGNDVFGPPPTNVIGG